MHIYHALESEVIGRTEFLSRSPERGRAKQPGCSAPSCHTTRDFADVGFGKPMSIVLRYVYTGQHLQEATGSNSIPMLLKSSINDISTFGAFTRALNMLKQRIGQKSRPCGPDFNEAGTALIYYTPAITSQRIAITIELILRDFDSHLFSIASQLFSSLSGIPIFQPASAYLMGASTVVKLADDIGQSILNEKPTVQQQFTLDFALDGATILVPSIWIVSQNPIDLAGYTFHAVEGLVSRGKRKPYDGEEPYVALSIHSRMQQTLSNFTPLLVTASILAQLYNQKDGIAVGTGSILSGVTLVGDLINRKKAEDVQQRLAVVQPGSRDYSMLNSQLAVFSANIREPLLRLPA